MQLYKDVGIGRQFIDYALAQDIHKIYRKRRHDIRRKHRRKRGRKLFGIGINRINQYTRQITRFIPLAIEAYLAYNVLAEKIPLNDCMRYWCYSAGPIRILEGTTTLMLIGREEKRLEIKNRKKEKTQMDLLLEKIGKQGKDLESKIT